MKKKLIVITQIVCICFLSLAFTGCTGASAPKNIKATLDTMNVVFEDNFDGTFISSKNWNTETRARRGGYWSYDQCTVKDGNLVIRTEYKENGSSGAGYYTGSLNTSKKVELTYGYYEIRCKAPAAEGLWASFLLDSKNMVGDTEVGGKNGAEIDIFEAPYYYELDNRNKVLHSVHVDGYGELHKFKSSPNKSVNNLFSEFHTFGVLWTKEYYAFYIDGVLSWKTDFGEGICATPEFLRLSVEVAGTLDKNNKPNFENPNNAVCWAGDIRNNKGGEIPVDFLVDYIKVYQSDNM
ncbi:MAG: glycoside hydrolase family 16 protein [Clostridia bacterium]